MDTLIQKIESLNNKSAMFAADYAAKLLKDNPEPWLSGRKEFETKNDEAIIILSNTYPNLSNSIKKGDSDEENRQGPLAKNFLKVLLELGYTKEVEKAINAEITRDPFTLMLIGAAIIFVLQTKFNASYEKLPDGSNKLKIDVNKEATSEDMIKKVFSIGGLA